MKMRNSKVIIALLLTVFAPILIFAFYVPFEEDIERAPTTIVYRGGTSGQYSDSVHFQAILTDTATGGGLQGKEIVFTLGSQEITTATNASGMANVNLALNQGAGDYTLLTIFGGDGYFSGSSDSDDFELLKEDSVLTYTGPLSVVSGSTIVLRAEFSEIDDEIGDLAGKRIVFSTDLASEVLTATTNSEGVAEKEVDLPGISSGTYSFDLEFEGDASYLSASCVHEIEITGGDGDDGCFIATAAFGDPLSSEVNVLRKFRDQYLLSNSVGQDLVAKYYKYSPALANEIRANSILKQMVRVGLIPFIRVVSLLVD